MGFCTFSNDAIKDNFIRLDNEFVGGFLPYASPDAVRVYIWGLYKCNNPSHDDNTLDDFARTLGLTPEDVISCFKYWEDLGLVQILHIEHFEIKYLPTSSGSMHLKKYNVDKYKNFNLALQDLYGSRMISTHEYKEFYATMESLHIDEDAMLLIANYCLKKKDKVGIGYILATAKNWAYSGVHTLDEVRARIENQEKNSSDIKLVLSAIGIKRSASDEEYNAYLGWINDYSMSPEIIVHIAKAVGKGTGAWNKLVSYVNKCYTLKLVSVKEIDDYMSQEQSLYDTAKSVCKNLGVRYERLDTVVDAYIAPWMSYGFDTPTLNKIANYCFTTTIRTLQGMNNVVVGLFKNGLITTDAIDNYINQLTRDDERIAHVLQSIGLVRSVNANDRTLLKTWIYDWNISQELLDYACTKCAGQYLPMQYLNKLLATYFNSGVTTVEQAEKINLPSSTQPVVSSKKPTARKYTKDELDSLFTNLDEVQL